MSPNTFLFTSIFLLIAISNIEGKILENHLKTNENWIFVEKYCFLSFFGTFHYEIEYDSSQGEINLLMYPDIQWEIIKRDRDAMNCQQKNNVLILEKRQIIRLSPNTDDSGCEIQSKNSTILYSCKNSRSFRSSKERWWYLGFSNCNSTKGLELKYKLTLTNGESEDGQPFKCTNSESRGWDFKNMNMFYFLLILSVLLGVLFES